MPAAIEAWRAGFWPAPAMRIWPRMTSSTSPSLDAGPLDRRLDRHLAEFVRGKAGERAIERTDRGAGGAGDDDRIGGFAGRRYLAAADMGTSWFWTCGWRPGSLSAPTSIDRAQRQCIDRSKPVLAELGGRCAMLFCSRNRRVKPLPEPLMLEAFFLGNVNVINRTLPARPNRKSPSGRHRPGGGDQEVRQPAPLQHRYQCLCDAR